jgi:hypothetical protein
VDGYKEMFGYRLYDDLDKFRDGESALMARFEEAGIARDGKFLDSGLGRICEEAVPISLEVAGMKVVDALLAIVSRSRKARFARLLLIKAPIVILENELEQGRLAEAGDYKALWRTDKEHPELLGWTVRSTESLKGNGGKAWTLLRCDEGEAAFFPQARFGRYLTVHKKKELKGNKA